MDFEIELPPPSGAGAPDIVASAWARHGIDVMRSTAILQMLYEQTVGTDTIDEPSTVQSPNSSRTALLELDEYTRFLKLTEVGKKALTAIWRSSMLSIASGHRFLTFVERSSKRLARNRSASLQDYQGWMRGVLKELGIVVGLERIGDPANGGCCETMFADFPNIPGGTVYDAFASDIDAVAEIEELKLGLLAKVGSEDSEETNSAHPPLTPLNIEARPDDPAIKEWPDDVRNVYRIIHSRLVSSVCKPAKIKVSKWYVELPDPNERLVASFETANILEQGFFEVDKGAAREFLGRTPSGSDARGIGCDPIVDIYSSCVGLPCASIDGLIKWMGERNLGRARTIAGHIAGLLGWTHPEAGDNE